MEVNFYIAEGFPRRQIKDQAALRRLDRLEKSSEGDPPTIYKISLSSAKKAPYLLLSTVDFQNWEYLCSVFPDKPDKIAEDELASALTLFYYDEGAPQINQDGCPRYLITALSLAAQKYAQDSDITVYRGTPKERKKKEKRGIVTAPVASISKKKKTPRAKKVSNPRQGKRAQTKEEFGERTIAFPPHTSMLERMKQLRDAGKLPTHGVVQQPQSPVSRHLSTQPVPVSDTPSVPSWVIMARMALKARGEVPSDVNWNDSDVHSQVIAEAKRRGTYKKESSSPELD